MDDITLERLEHLKEANRIRSARSKLKRELVLGDVTVAELLKNPPEYIFTMRVLDLILATPRIGVVRAKSILGPHISVHKTIGNLTPHQRKYILAKIQNTRRGWVSIRENR
jgi:hypothetical protein